MSDRIKLRPMAEAPKTPVDADGSGPTVLLYGEERTDPYIGCWNEVFAVWMVDSTYRMELESPIGWLPLPEAERAMSKSYATDAEELIALRKTIAHVRKLIASERDANKWRRHSAAEIEAREYILDRLEVMI